MNDSVDPEIDITGKCSETHDCVCDLCQEKFEKIWAIDAAEKNLCLNCGIPNELSMQALWDTQYSHFFQPCDLCKPLLNDFLNSEGVCVECRAPLTQCHTHCPTKRKA